MSTIDSCEDVLLLNPSSTRATVELHGVVTPGSSSFTGPPELRMTAYIKAAGSSSWTMRGETQKLGVTLFLDDRDELLAGSYLVRVLLGRLGPKPNPYDLSMVFRDQNGDLLKLKTAGDQLSKKGELADQLGGFSLKLRAENGGA